MTVGFKTILLIGLGLLGGSVARGLKKRNPEYSIFAYDPDEESLQRAARESIIDDIYSFPQTPLPDVELIILAVAPHHIPGYLDFFIQQNFQGTITDIASIKRSLLTYFQNLKNPLPFQFISSHPMAGSEKSGYRASSESLFDRAACILCPYKNITLFNTIADLSTFWILLGCQTPVLLYPEEHDELIGLISHFPHLVAVILTQIAKKRVSSSSLLKTIIGPGFKDTTRIAQGSAQLWTEILFDNKEILTQLLQDLKKEIHHLEKALYSQEEIQQYLEETASFRKKIQDNFL